MIIERCYDKSSFVFLDVVESMFVLHKSTSFYTRLILSFFLLLSHQISHSTSLLFLYFLSFSILLYRLVGFNNEFFFFFIEL